jgi:hypothetical protein
VLLIEELNGELVIKNRLCLLKGDLVLLEVRRRLRCIPFKLENKYIVFIEVVASSRRFSRCLTPRLCPGADDPTGA